MRSGACRPPRSLLRHRPRRRGLLIRRLWSIRGRQQERPPLPPPPLPPWRSIRRGPARLALPPWLAALQRPDAAAQLPSKAPRRPMHQRRELLSMVGAAVTSRLSCAPRDLCRPSCRRRTCTMRCWARCCRPRPPGPPRVVLALTGLAPPAPSDPGLLWPEVAVAAQTPWCRRRPRRAASTQRLPPPRRGGSVASTSALLRHSAALLLPPGHLAKQLWMPLLLEWLVVSPRRWIRAP